MQGVIKKTLSVARSEISGQLLSPKYNRRYSLVRSPIWANKDLLESKFCALCNRVEFGYTLCSGGYIKMHGVKAAPKGDKEGESDDVRYLGQVFYK
jgi:hypothetical protein